MPRKPRELYPEQYFHIISQSNNHIYLFKVPADFKKYLSLVKDNFFIGHIKCFHYCLMNTHAHFIVQMPKTVLHVPDIMKSIHLSYYHYYKKKYSYVGSLWRGRYKAEFIDTDRYMLGCGLYIEHNPVNAGMVKTPEEYPWSSYGHWIGSKKDAFLSEHPLDVVKNYKEIAREYMEVYVEYIKLTSVPFVRPRKN